MYILGIESSCDETAVSVVEATANSRKVLSNCIASQIDIHRLYGGVVPEIAGRAHIEAISNLTHEALIGANVSLSDIGAIGVTNRPGLVGALLVGVNFAKSLSYANGIPLVPVHHLRGHIAANYLAHEDLKPPFLALVVSGGHTSLVMVHSHTSFETVGRTRDDAMGEAFDKVARVMGIPYPGGAQMDKLAQAGDRFAIKFPSAAIMGENLDFSFSGLKTAVINYLHTAEMKGEAIKKEDVAASFTLAVVDAAEKKLRAAIARYAPPAIVLAGGVSANSHLRKGVERVAKQAKIPLYLPPLSLCGDNAAMIAMQAYYEYEAGVRGGNDLNAYPTSDISGKE